MSSATAMARSGTDDLKSDVSYKTVYEEKSKRGLNDQSNNVMAEQSYTKNRVDLRAGVVSG